MPIGPICNCMLIRCVISIISPKIFVFYCFGNPSAQQGFVYMISNIGPIGQSAIYWTARSYNLLIGDPYHIGLYKSGLI